MKKILLAFFLFPLLSGAQTINTIAGNGSAGYGGDGGQATAAAISDPGGLAFDNLGNIYIGGFNNSTIRKITPAGIITTIAGTGTGGFSGDGGPATAAQLNGPVKIVRDPAGNIFVADQWNNRVRKISASGIITTVAGNGSATYFGDGGQATAAGISAPTGVDLDISGNLYIADYSNHRIRKVTPAGIISTVAGNGSGGYSGDGVQATATSLGNPFGITVDTPGNLYIADQQNDRIRKVTTSGVITTFAGIGIAGALGDGGQATAAQLNKPGAITMDHAGNFYIADAINHKVRKVSSTTGIITTVVGIGTAGYSGDGGPATAAQLNSLNEIAFDNSGRLLICDNTNNRVRILTNCANAITTHPTHDTVNEGIDAVYTVTTSMPSPVYQWQEDPGTGFVNLANVWPYSGVYTSTLTIHHTSIFLHATHYRCIITNGSPCADTSGSAILIVMSTTGMGSLSADMVKVFPNPADNEVTVQLPGLNSAGNVQLINGLGQLIAEQNINKKGSAAFNLAQLPAGIYILKIQCGTQSLYRKIYKN